LRKDHQARGEVQRSRKIALPDVGKVPGAKKGLLPAFLEPSQAEPVEKPPSGPRWVHEIKHDGYRIQARIDGKTLKLLTRKNLDWTDRFRTIAAALKQLGLASAWLDGEIVVEETSGVSSFNGLQADLSTGRQDRMRYYLFDVLYCDGYDLTKATLIDRKNLLQQMLAGVPQHSPIRFSDHIEQDGPLVFAHAGRLGLEGIISKRKDLPFRAGRGDHWLKAKCVAREEFVILGYIPSTVAPGSAGALLLGYYFNKKLYYAGRVGTGWSQDEARALRDALEKLNAARPALANQMPAGSEKGVRWAKPKLVGEVQHRGWSEDRLIRQSSFKGLREDKSADEIVFDELPKPGRSLGPMDIGGVRLTHPERVLFEDGVTKQALAEFYAGIADWILPHLANRVLSLLRSPSGDVAKSFFAKHPWHGLTDDVSRIDVGEKEPMLAIHDLAGLMNLVQAGVVEIHPWGSTVDHLEQPDRLFFDLDPGEDVPWRQVIAAAQEVRQRLDDRGLKSFVKTSGGKGLHVVVPIVPRMGWDEAKTFTGEIAAAMAKARPDLYVATMSKRARRGRILVDFFRNGRGATAVAAFSTRARPSVPVSTPLAWDELSEGIRGDHFTIDNLPQRLDFLTDDPWPGFFKLKQKI